MGQIAYIFEERDKQQTDDGSITGTRAVLGTNPILLYDIPKTENAYPLGWFGVSVLFAITLSGGAVDSSVDLFLHTAFDGDTTYDDVEQSSKSLSTSDLDQSGTTRYTWTMLTETVGPAIIFEAERTAGDRTITCDVNYRRFMELEAG